MAERSPPRVLVADPQPQLVPVLQQRAEPQKAAAAIARQAEQLWRRSGRSCDNITLICVHF
jgi:serine/threonine protein phosphatase PrpC